MTAEYAVLDGALALGIPTKYGQSLKLEPLQSNIITWESLDADGEIWFKASFDSRTLQLISSSNSEVGLTLERLLSKAKALNHEFNTQVEGLKIVSQLTFPRSWGLGSSSTLINNIAQWARVNPYELLHHTFGGSGYDIACAQYNSPILYQLKEGSPVVRSITFNPSFRDQLFFVYLNQKQNSRDAISNYRKQAFNMSVLVKELSSITKRILGAKNINEFESLLQIHEEVLSKVLKIKPIKEQSFPDYFGTVKSLGGWGGDFVLATGNKKKTPGYFNAKGFDIVIPYEDMVL